jgi:hypothetical protein
MIQISLETIRLNMTSMSIFVFFSGFWAITFEAEGYFDICINTKKKYIQWNYKNTLKIKKFKPKVKWCFWLFTVFVFCNSKVNKWAISCLVIKKYGHACTASKGTWEALAPFELLMQRLSTSKNVIWFVIGSVVVFSLYCCCTCIHRWSSLVPVDLTFSYLIENYNLTLLIIDIPISVIVLLIFYSGLLVEVFFSNFIIQSQFTRYYILQCDPYFLDF